MANSHYILGEQKLVEVKAAFLEGFGVHKNKESRANPAS